jgi:hypothetical protein
MLKRELNIQTNLQTIPTNIAKVHLAFDKSLPDIILYNTNLDIAYIIPAMLSDGVVNILHDNRLFTLQDGKYIESKVHSY